tara:strand:+ start:9963 stop:10439 length:477 start_codon:yes stop_codon:yes gene_type:complete
MKKIFLLFIILYSSCTKNKEIILDEKLKKELSEYILKNPIVKKNSELLDVKFPYPSYHIYFNNKSSDTILELKLSPFVNGFSEFYTEYNSEGEKLYFDYTPNGFFIYEGNPVIVINGANKINKQININGLTKKIPDSLKWELGMPNIHLNVKSEYYIK